MTYLLKNKTKQKTFSSTRDGKVEKLNLTFNLLFISGCFPALSYSDIQLVFPDATDPIY